MRPDPKYNAVQQRALLLEERIHEYLRETGACNCHVQIIDDDERPPPQSILDKILRTCDATDFFTEANYIDLTRVSDDAARLRDGPNDSYGIPHVPLVSEVFCRHIYCATSLQSTELFFSRLVQWPLSTARVLLRRCVGRCDFHIKPLATMAAVANLQPVCDTLLLVDKMLAKAKPAPCKLDIAGPHTSPVMFAYALSCSNREQQLPTVQFSIGRSIFHDAYTHIPAVRALVAALEHRATEATTALETHFFQQTARCFYHYRPEVSAP